MASAARFGLTVLLGSTWAMSAAFAGPVCHPAAHHVVHRAKSVATAGIGVMMDQARLVTFTRPAKTVFIANPMVADVNIVDAQHAFVLGKTFGLTNLVALDKDGEQIESRQVMVTNHEAAVTLNRGADQYNYSCTLAHCEITPRPGDPYDWFKGTMKAISEHQEQSNKNALPPQQGQNLASAGD